MRAVICIRGRKAWSFFLKILLIDLFHRFIFVTFIRVNRAENERSAIKSHGEARREVRWISKVKLDKSAVYVC